MIFGFLLAVCFNPYTYTAATNPRWAFLALSLPIVIRFSSSPNHFTLNHLLWLIFLGWCALTLTWTPNNLDGFQSLIQLLIIAGAFALGAGLATLRPILIGMAIGLTISSLIIITPLKELVPHQIVQIEIQGLLGNRNILAETAAIVLIGCLLNRVYWALPALIPSIIMPPIARGALVGIAAAFLMWLWSRSRMWTIMLALLSICAVLISIKLRPFSVNERLDAWTDTLKGLTILGHGLGSFRYLFPFLTHTFDGAARIVDHPHNEALELWFEVGFVGLSLCIIAAIASLGSADSRTRPAMAAYAAIAMFAFPSHVPFTAFLAGLLLGHSARNGHSLRDVAVRFGLPLRARNVG